MISMMPFLSSSFHLLSLLPIFFHLPLLPFSPFSPSSLSSPSSPFSPLSPFLSLLSFLSIPSLFSSSSPSPLFLPSPSPSPSPLSLPSPSPSPSPSSPSPPLSLLLPLPQDLSCNLLPDLPNSICQLSSLQHLDLHRNELKDIPSGVQYITTRCVHLVMTSCIVNV